MLIAAETKQMMNALFGYTEYATDETQAIIVAALDTARQSDFSATKNPIYRGQRFYSNEFCAEYTMKSIMNLKDPKGLNFGHNHCINEVVEKATAGDMTMAAYSALCFAGHKDFIEKVYGEGHNFFSRVDQAAKEIAGHANPTRFDRREAYERTLRHYNAIGEQLIGKSRDIAV
jgi:hypothetical protein